MKNLKNYYDTEKQAQVFKFYDTNILMFQGDKVILNNGGFLTKLTFKALNEILYNFNIPVKVYIKKGQAFISNKEGSFPFVNCTVLNKEGQYINNTVLI